MRSESTIKEGSHAAAYVQLIIYTVISAVVAYILFFRYRVRFTTTDDFLMAGILGGAWGEGLNQSVVFYCAEEHTAFTGDTLFRMSVGRTDFDGGSYTQLMSSLANVLAKLPADTVILPGHGPQSTIDYELRYNPYLT